VVLRSADDDQARRLSGMGQLVGYGVGALGPLAVGALLALSGSWTLALALLLVLAGGYAALALVAGRPGTLAVARVTSGGRGGRT
jgi:CP family cyanate transporter-like MFS transporter